MRLPIWLKRANSASFGVKLLVSYLLLAIVPVMATGYLAYENSVRSVREHTRDNIQGTLLQIRNNIAYQMEDIKRVSAQLTSDQSLQQLLRSKHNSWSSYETTSGYLLPALRNAVNSSANPIQLYVYLYNESLPEIYDVVQEGVDPLSRPANYQVLHVDRLQRESWFDREFFQSDQYDDTVLWAQVGTDTTYRNISAFGKIYDLRKLEKIGYVKITVKIDDLLAEAQHSRIGDASTLFVVDGSGRTIYSSSESNSPLSGRSDTEDGVSELVIREPIPGLDWAITASIPHKVLARDAGRVTKLTLLVLAVNVMVILSISFWISKYFSRRVTKLVKSLQSFMDGDLSRRIRYSGKDEFSRISAAFNSMGESIERLIRQNYEANLQKKEAELSTLQAQINPHFLYNALSSIGRLADFGEKEKLSRMVLELSKFYRLALNQGKTFVSARQELDHTRTYIEIQKIKYGDRLQVYYDIDPAVYPYETVKIIIQPFIENVLEHAWYGESIAVRITAGLEDGKVLIQVIDNGVGMNRDTLAQLMNRDGIRIGYGIRNVDERIRLYYGESYGVSLYSRQGIGSTVTITLPARPVATANAAKVGEEGGVS